MVNEAKIIYDAKVESSTVVGVRPLPRHTASAAKVQVKPSRHTQPPPRP